MAHRTGAPRGAVIVWVALALFMLFAIFAWVLNVGHLTTVKGELQTAVDSAALAGALALTGNAERLEPAVDASEDFAGYHFTDRPDRYPVAASEVRFGEWRHQARGPCPNSSEVTPFHDSAGARFCEIAERDAAAAFRINAVYVRAERAEGSPGGGALTAILGGFLGNRRSIDVGAEAIALTGGPIAPSCVRLPMVLGVGCLTDSGGGAACAPDAPPDSAGPMYTLGLSSTPVRSAGWSVFTDSNPSTTRVCNFLQNSAGGCAAIDLSPDVEFDTSDGNRFNSNCTGSGYGPKVCDWFKQFVGQRVEVPTVTFSGNVDEACPSHYVHNAQIVGTATIDVLAVSCKVSSGDCLGALCSDPAWATIFASSDAVLTRLVCNHRSGENQGTGGAWTGTSTYRPVLVQTRGAAVR